MAHCIPVQHTRVRACPPWHGIPRPVIGGDGGLLAALMAAINSVPSSDVIKRQRKGQLSKLTYAVHMLTTSRIRSDRKLTAKYEAMRDATIERLYELRVMLAKIRALENMSVRPICSNTLSEALRQRRPSLVEWACEP